MLTRKQILKLADKKMELGYKKYGRWDAKTDTRDMKKEATEELLDCINYCIMALQKLS